MLFPKCQYNQHHAIFEPTILSKVNKERIVISQEHVQTYNEQGFVIIPGLFSSEEVAMYTKHFMELREAGSYPGDSAGIDIGLCKGCADSQQVPVQEQLSVDR